MAQYGIKLFSQVIYNFYKDKFMEVIKKSFGEQLKAYRKMKNFTQEKFAEKIGINLRQLARIESGESFVSAETLFNICAALEISPKLLFDFEIKEEILMTGTANKVYFKAIKKGNLIQHLNSKKNSVESDCIKNDDFDKRMLKVAMNTNRNIIVDELQNGIVYLTKVYKPNGTIETTNKNDDENFNKLLDFIYKIKNEPKKIEYMNLAQNSLTDKNALEELKSMIKGIELTLK